MYTTIDGLNAIDVGSGKTILMLHGYLSCKESFLRQIDFLKSFFRVVAVDLNGFGGQKMDYPFSLNDYKNQVNRVIDRLNVDKVNVLAHSFGARIVFKMLPENEKIDRLVITGGAGLKPRFSLKKRLKIIGYKVLKPFLSEQAKRRFGSSDYKMLDDVMKKSFIKIVNEHIDCRLCSVKNRTLLIYGENDEVTPLYMAKRFNKLLTNSDLVVLKNAGHFAFIDKPNEFNFIVKEFLL